MSDEGVISFLPGFAWAVPEAFAPAVCSYRFEQGDVLYREQAGYGPLAGRIEKGLTAIQLRQPPRSARVIPGEYEGDRRLSNWQSELELERVDLAAGTSELLTTTQGRLLMLLWRGDEAWLHATLEDPPVPRSARDLAQLLRDGALDLGTPRGGREGCRFVFVVDLSSDASRARARAVASALGALASAAVTDRTPAELGASSSAPFHPTLVLRELVLRGVDLAAAEAALKRVLYGGAGDSERFQIARHGLLESIGGRPPV
jgi:hypothetical protein